MRALILSLFLPLPAFANMSADEFESYVSGKTLTYSDRGIVYGVEQYLPDRRVRWSFVGDTCREGYWYDQNGEICFVYEDRPSVPQCWVFSREKGRLNALFVGDEEEQSLYEAQHTSDPMVCLGPEVGV